MLFDSLQPPRLLRQVRGVKARPETVKSMKGLVAVKVHLELEVQAPS
jgi:hypothetical protein